MNPSLNAKLESLLERYEELEHLLSDAEVIAVQEKFRAYSKEYAELEPVVHCFREQQVVTRALADAELMRKDSDLELRAMAEEEITSCRVNLERLDAELQKLLLPKDSRDACNVFLEIRAGTGGDEAALFSGDLFKMYSRYAESQGWRV
jgi:peptide chain release factor 1